MDILLFVLSFAMSDGAACFPPHQWRTVSIMCPQPPPEMEEVWVDGRWMLQKKSWEFSFTLNAVTTTAMGTICTKQICARTYPKVGGREK